MKKLIALLMTFIMLMTFTTVYADTEEEIKMDDIYKMEKYSYGFAETYEGFDGYMVYCMNDTGFIATFLYGPEDEFCNDVAVFYNFKTGDDFLIYDGCMVLPDIFYQLCDSFGILIADVAPYDEFNVVEMMAEIKRLYMDETATPKNIV